MTSACPTCGAPIRPNAPGGHCTRCLLGLGRLQPEPDPSHIAPFDTEALLDPMQVRHFGDYELLEEVARGGMGVVYKAHQISLHRTVALKMILAGQLATPAAIQRFRLEAKAAAKLGHPQIVPVYEVGEHETQHYFTMKFVEGGSLADRLHQFQWPTTPTPPGPRASSRHSQRIATFMFHLADALDYAHAHGILHRDLKPNNILIEQGQPLLTDFGLAKLTAGSSGLTLSSAVLGSPSYMAPEQAAGDPAQVATTADVYGLGAVLYELLTGRPPFTGPNAVATLQRVLHHPPIPPSRLNPAISRDLETICLKCLEKDPLKRYPSARAVAEEFTRVQKGEPILARPVAPAEKFGRWCQRNPAIATLSALALISLLLGIAGILWQWQRAETSRTQTQEANFKLSKSLDHLYWRTVDSILEQDDASKAVAHLADRLRTSPDSWQAATYAMSILEQQAFAMPAGPEIVRSNGLARAQATISPDGSLIAVANIDHSITIHDSLTGTLRSTLPHPAEPLTLIFAPPDHVLISTATDGAIRFWNPNTGSLIQTLPSRSSSNSNSNSTPTTPFTTFTQDGATLASFSDPDILLWKTKDALQHNTRAARWNPGFQVQSMQLSSDGKHLLLHKKPPQSQLHILDTSTGKTLFSAPPGIQILQAHLNSTGTRVALLTNPYQILVYDIHSHQQIGQITSRDSGINHVLLTPNGDYALCAFYSGNAHVISILTGDTVSPRMNHLYNIIAMSLNNEGSRLVTASQDHTARVWDTRSGLPLSERLLHQGDVLAASFTSDDHGLLTIAKDSGQKTCRIQAWTLRNPVASQTFAPPGGRDLNAVRLSPDGQWMVVPTWTPTPNLWIYDVPKATLAFGPAPVHGDAYGIEFTPDMRGMILATANGWVSGWSVGDWKPLWKPVRLSNAIQPTALSPDGTLFATGGPDGFVRLLKTTSGQLVHELNQGSYVKGLRFSPQGDRLIAGSANGTAVIWNPVTGERLVTLKGHTAEILSVEFSPDAQRVVTASYDSTVRIWDALSGTPLTPPLRHQGEASHASFSPDGKSVATAARDGTARIWNAITGQPLVDWMRHVDTVQSVEFHQDRRRLLTRDHAGFRLWDVKTGEPITIHYRSPVTGGVGLDSPTLREIFSKDGTQIVLGCSANYASLIQIPNPSSDTPLWFPDFLESVAGQRLGDAGEYIPVPTHQFLQWRTQILALPPDNEYVRWAQRYLQTPNTSQPSNH